MLTKSCIVGHPCTRRIGTPMFYRVQVCKVFFYSTIFLSSTAVVFLVYLSNIFNTLVHNAIFHNIPNCFTGYGQYSKIWLMGPVAYSKQILLYTCNVIRLFDSKFSLIEPKNKRVSLFVEIFNTKLPSSLAPSNNYSPMSRICIHLHCIWD